MSINFLHLSMIISGGITLLFAAGVVFAKKPLNSALCLIVTFFMLAANYALLRADLIAVLQILVYAGAIMVLVVFALMLLGPAANAEEPRTLLSKLILLALGLIFAALIFAFFAFLPDVPASFSFNEQFVGDIKSFGTVLFTKYLWAFEITGILLLATTIGVTILAKEPKRPLPPGRGLRAKQTAEIEEEE